jgi:hypothetical protein
MRRRTVLPVCEELALGQARVVVDDGVEVVVSQRASLLAVGLKGPRYAMVGLDECFHVEKL